MAASGRLSHNPSLTGDVTAQVTAAWSRLGENVGVGASAADIQRAFEASSGHLANIVGSYNRIGVGAVVDPGGRIWVTIVFIEGPPPPAAEVPVTGVSASAGGVGQLHVVERAADCERAPAHRRRRSAGEGGSRSVVGSSSTRP